MNVRKKSLTPHFCSSAYSTSLLLCEAHIILEMTMVVGEEEVMVVVACSQ
ncbi:hypothetical protein Scep_003053 [Stephania cephalantha]|uniref:Uncharacterized protein n=1 Tax=Stephania cephalantha TaxID=152367 RepID=A0AAP0KS70_9MAGN